MADLKWSEVNAKLPAGSIAVVSGKVMIDVSAVTGDVVDALTDEGVTEFAFKFLEGAGQAQITANAVPGAVQLSAFPLPSYGTPVRNASGDVFSSASASVIGLIPVNKNSIEGNTL